MMRKAVSSISKNKRQTEYVIAQPSHGATKMPQFDPLVPWRVQKIKIRKLALTDF